MTASPPVRSTNRQAASTFGAIEPARTAAGAARRGSRSTIGVAAGVPQSRSTYGTSVSEHETLGAELLGEQRGRQVLVDHGFDAAQTVLVGNDRDAAAAGADDDAPASSERSIACSSTICLRLRRGDDTRK